MKNSILSLTIGWLYPSLMSTYGDRGNITCLQKRCEWRGIQCDILHIDEKMRPGELSKIDMIFGGGAQDRQQEIVMRDLKSKKDDVLTLIESGKPGLFVCGSPQLMGTYYEPAEGTRIDGIGVFDMVSKHPGKGAQRCIGNIVGKVNWEALKQRNKELTKYSYIVGFENHGGRTHLSEKVRPFAQVVKGYGNNGEDKTEGVVYKNAVGCYFHGPLLPKNPHIADHFIIRTLEVKYKEKISLTSLDDTLEWQAHNYMLKTLGVDTTIAHKLKT